MVYISIHAPQWGATPGSKPSVLSVIYFNPRTPVGCDSACHDRAVRAYGISIHAPQWGATMTTFALLEDYTFQSTHPSGVRHNTPFSGAITLSISIHAPQWGATSAFWYSTGGCAYFNPRTPVGCDHRPGQGEVHRIRISIHAPQWGATRPVPRRDRADRISIHAPQWGATVRPARIRLAISNFNPRTPVGCDDVLPLVVLTAKRISIHAPQWGATAPSGTATRTATRFQSTHPSGVRPAARG